MHYGKCFEIVTVLWKELRKNKSLLIDNRSLQW